MKKYFKLLFYVMLLTFSTKIIAQPCQTIIVNLDNANSVPTPVNDEIRLCFGNTNVVLAGYGEYPQNGTYYPQSDVTSTFTWFFGDGTQATGQTVNHTYSEAKGYSATLRITDINNCVEEILFKVIVSPGPIINSIDDEIGFCLNDDYILSASELPVSTVEYDNFSIVSSTELILAETTFLPDGSGDTYTTSLTYDQFASGQTLTNSNDLIIYANIEHSFLGDLEVEIECPNGQSTTLIPKDGKNEPWTQLGEPIYFVGEGTNPGIGYDYWWSMNADYGTMAAESGNYFYNYTDLSGHNHINRSYLPSGIYLPEQSFSNLVGCPLNGEWTIYLTDYLTEDNGYIFAWGLQLNEALLPVNWDYTVNVADIWWEGDDIINTSGFTATIQPQNSGNLSYNVFLEDDFGCITQDVVNVQVYPLPNLNLGDDIVICDAEQVILDAGAGINLSYFWSNNSTNRTITVTESGTYSVTVTNSNSCSSYDEINVSLSDIDIFENDISFCEGSEINLNAGEGFDTYLWSDNSTENSITVSESGEYWVQVTYDLCSVIDYITVIQNLKPIVDLGDDFSSCENENITLDVPFIANFEYEWNNSSIQNQINVIETGEYWVIVTNEFQCQNSDTVNVTVNPLPVVNLGNDISVCEPNVVTLNVPQNENYTYEWSNSSTENQITVSQSGDYSVTVSNEFECSATDLIAVIINPLPLVDLGDDFSSCENENITLDVPFISNYEYEWNNSSIQNQISVTESGEYWLIVTNEFECQNSDTVLVTINPVPNVNAGSNQVICEGESVTLTATGANIYEWNYSVQQSIAFYPNETRTYLVTGWNSFNCSNTAEVTVNVNEKPELNLASNYNLCKGSTVEIEISDEFASYLWSTGNETNIGEIDTAGTYMLTIWNGFNCSNSLNFEVTEIDLPEIVEINTEDCGIISIVANDIYQPLEYSIDSLNFQNSNVFENLIEGSYNLWVKNSENCISKKTFDIALASEIFIPKFFSPNFDGVNDTWEISGISEYPNTTITIYNRFGKLLTNYSSSDIGWDGTYMQNPVPSDSYWYVIELNSQNRIYSGYVTVIR